jgi:hypothetical protein
MVNPKLIAATVELIRGLHDFARALAISAMHSCATAEKETK